MDRVLEPGLVCTLFHLLRLQNRLEEIALAEIGTEITANDLPFAWVFLKVVPGERFEADLASETGTDYWGTGLVLVI